MKGYSDDYSWFKGMVIAMGLFVFIIWLQTITGGITIQFSNEPRVNALEMQVSILEDELGICGKQLTAQCSPVECKCPDCGTTAVVFFFVGGVIFIVISAWFKRFLSEYEKEVIKHASPEKRKAKTEKKTVKKQK